MLPESVEELYRALPDQTRTALESAIAAMVEVKRGGGRIMVVLGSGPNLHEGVTTLVAELIGKGLIDSVTTSAAVIAHEMAGTLDRVKRVEGADAGFGPETPFLPMGGVFEFTELSDKQLERLRTELPLDDGLLASGRAAKGTSIIKAAGNMAYPMGLRTEHMSQEILSLCRMLGLPFETVAGWGADPRTMIGAAAERGVPVLVTIPQLVGGGAVGLAIGDSIPVSGRSARIAAMIDQADLIVESAVALTQEIHDGPLECYTGHGIWANWQGHRTTSLRGKRLVRIDLDARLEQAIAVQRGDGAVQRAINEGLPKTKLTGIPFRMEMSAFARLEGSIAVIADIGVAWPFIATQLAGAMDVDLDFMSYPQQTAEGKHMREWIADHVQPLDRQTMLRRARLQAAHGSPA